MLSRSYAAIDCGTNSVRLLVVRDDDGGLVEVDRRLHLTRLGQGVDATGRFDPAALERTMSALDDFGEQLDRLGVTRRRVVATSAARDAANSAEFFAGVRARIGVDAEIISGDEEARLSFAGAVVALPDLPDPVLVMDIGGGSTELVLGHGGVAEQAASLDVGSVRLRERLLRSDPPTATEVEDARGLVRPLLEASGVDLAAARSWVGVGGTATSLSALAQGLPEYDRAKVHGSVITASQLDALTSRLLAMPVAQVLNLPTMQPGRADVICAGALICDEIGRAAGIDLRVSEADLLDAMVADLAADGRRVQP